MAYLNWISDEALLTATETLLNRAAEIKKAAQKNMNKNVIDPFSSIFQMGGFELGYDEWLTGEITRQAQKSLQNHVGDFHQTILGSIEGWENKKTGAVIDLINEDRGIIAEVKNKHNTVKKSDLSTVYDTLANAVLDKLSLYKGFKAYYVTIIPAKAERLNKPFTPSDNKKGQRKEINESIREIDGASFYELVTGNVYALRDLFLVLPKVIEDLNDKGFDDEEILPLVNLFNKAYGH